MRARTFGAVLAAVAVGYLLLTQPEVVGVAVMLLLLVAVWRFRPRLGVRR
ncbi:hypothetical protein AB0J47_02580 [Nocardia sp. NPDC049737]